MQNSNGKDRVECSCGKLLFKVVDGKIEIKCANSSGACGGSVVRLSPIIVSGELITFEREDLSLTG